MPEDRLHRVVAAPLTVSQVARIIHGAMELLNDAQAATSMRVPHMPALYPAWGQLNEADSALFLGGVRLVLASATISPASLHEYWMKNRMAAGWVYGPVRDYTRKTHPSIRPFHELPVDEQLKDVLFRSMVEAMAPLVVNVFL